MTEIHISPNRERSETCVYIVNKNESIQFIFTYSFCRCENVSFHQQFEHNIQGGNMFLLFYYL
jgi:hypothetical protein